MKKEQKQYRLLSTPMVHTVGMVKNYEYAAKVNDVVFMGIMESCYDLPKEGWAKIATGDYEIENDVVVVTI